MDTPLTDQLRTLRNAAGLTDRSAVAGRLEVLGADRHRFLNAYVTCNVKSLTPGDGAYGFFTNPQGRILADVVVLAHEDRLWLEVPPDQEDALLGHLKKYVLADRVELRPLADMVPLTLAGPRAGEVLGGVLPPPGSWRHMRAMVRGTEVALQRHGRLGAEAYTLWVSASIASHLEESLQEDWRVGRVGLDALEVLRTEAGIPRFGTDFGPDNFPQETGAEEAVSYTKGCYLGQEVVARIHYRGGVQKTLRGLAFPAGATPEAGAPLSFEDREAGTVGTVVHSPALGHPIGLAILHRRAAEPGTRLTCAGGEAEVRELPFVQTAG